MLIVSLVMMVSVVAPYGTLQASSSKDKQPEAVQVNEIDLKGINTSVTVTDSEKVKFNKYVELKNNSKFFVGNDAKTELSKEKYKKLKDAVKQSNKIISNNKSADLNIIGPNQDQSGSMSTLAFKVGKNDGETYWWGVRVYINKYSLMAFGGGLALGGIWMPEPFISKILASLGVIVGWAPGGIQFDMNWAQIALIPVPNIPISQKVSNVRFQ